MVVTSLRTLGSAGERLSLTLDRKPAGQVETSDAERLGLARGTRLDDDHIRPLIEAIDRCGARKRALRLLATRDRSTGELRDRLRRAGHHADAIDATLQRLVDAGLIDDEAFAERMASSLAGRGNAGRRLIETKLAQRGLDRSTASLAARNASQDRDALEDATGLAVKRASRGGSSLDRQTLTRRLSGYLARRGFEPDVIREAVSTALQARGADDDPTDHGTEGWS